MVSGMANPVISRLIDRIEDEVAVILSQNQLETLNKDKDIKLHGYFIATTNYEGHLLLLEVDPEKGVVASRFLLYVEPPYTDSLFEYPEYAFQIIQELIGIIRMAYHDRR